MSERREKLSAKLAPESYDDSDGTIGLIVYTGAVVDRYDEWTGEPYTLALDVSQEAIDLTRLDAGTSPFLDSHKDRDSNDVLGALVAGSADLAGGELRVRAKLSVDPAKAGKVADIKAGVLRAVSVGAAILASETTAAAKGKGRHVQVTRWRLDEASIVPIGADLSAQTFAAQSPPVGAAELPQGGVSMDEIQLAADNAVKAERLRVVEIDKCAAAVKADAAQVAKLKSDGVAIEVARDAMINAAAERDRATASQPVQMLRDAGDTAIEMARDAILAKALPRNVEAKIDGKAQLLWDPSKAQALRGKRTVDILRSTLAALGQSVDGLSDRQIAKRAVFATSSSDLPDLFGDSVGKALLYGYAGTTKQYEAFCKRVTTPGLHARTPVILSGASAVQEMAEGAAYPEQTVSDTAESYSAKKYGGQMVLTLEALLRDNLDALTQVPTALTNGLVHKQNQIVAALFAAGSGYGPTLAADSAALFASGHSNLVDTGSGGAPTIARIAALRALLAKQEDANGNLEPRQGKIILVPAELGHIAEAILFGAAMPSSIGAETRTPSMGGLQVVQFDYLASAAYWYLLADPMLSPVIEVASPDNESEVWADSTIDYDTDSRKFKAGMYFAAAAVDFRGAAMNRGA